MADRHATTTLSDGTVLTYLRDATGRVVQRTLHPVTGPDEVQRYAYSAGSQYAVLDGSNALLSRTVSLPGGASVTLPATGTAVWSYPNLHGDDIITADSAGVRGQLCSYDPFGQPIDPATGDIATTTADDAVPDTQPGETDFGWVGSNSKLYEHQGSIATIEMGARLYVAALGRFLQVDPISGANSNDYIYPNDPVNGFDLSGKMPLGAFDVGDSSIRPQNANYIGQAAAGGRKKARVDEVRRGWAIASAALSAGGLLLDAIGFGVSKIPNPVAVIVGKAISALGEAAGTVSTAIDCTQAVMFHDAGMLGMIQSPNCVFGLMGAMADSLDPGLATGGLMGASAQVLGKGYYVVKSFNAVSRAGGIAGNALTIADWGDIIAGSGQNW